MVSLLKFQYSLNLLHLYRIWCLVLIGYDPHGHKMSSLEKNLRQYLLIGVWLIIALVALIYNELEWLKCCSQGLSLMIDGSIGLRLLSSNFRKNFPLRSATWKDIFHCKRTELHSCFLQKSQDDLHGKIGIELNLLESLSTKAYSGHFCLLGQFQNSMQLLMSSKKKSLILWEIAVKWI